MFKNYLKTALRNLIQHSGFSLLNITGLAVSLAVCILIMFWVNDEMTYNQFLPNAKHLYRINKQYQIGTEVSYNSSTPLPLASTLRKNFAEVREATFFRAATGLIRYENHQFKETRMCRSDSAFFKVFSFEFISGNAAAALRHPNSIVITQSIAHKYFGDQDPIGRTLTLDNTENYQVTGVLRDIPAKCSYRFDFFLQLPQAQMDRNRENWGRHNLNTFVLLNENVDITGFDQRLAVLAKEHLPQEKIAFQSQPLLKIHLFTIDGQPAGMKYVTFFSIIAVFILIIACINFTNLCTARATRRTREIGLRKVIGARRLQLIIQFLSESVIQAFIALICALIFIELIRPAFNRLTDKVITLQYLNFNVIGMLLMTAFLTGILAGIYPALVISGFQPVKVLKGGAVTSGKNKIRLRRVLVVTQFVIAIILLICTLVIYQQIRYIRTKELGFKSDNICYLQLNSAISQNYHAFRTELIRIPEIINVARSSELPTNTFMIARGVTWPGKDTQETVAFGFAAVDYEYIPTLRLQIVDGRGFSHDFASDSQAVVINQKAAALLGEDSPVGKYLNPDTDSQIAIIGVVRDFNALPLTMAIEPLLLLLEPNYYNFVLVDIRSTDTKRTISQIETIWQQFSPFYPFEYHFLDEQFERNYRDEIRMSRLFSYFVGFAIFISCLGLFGLAAYTAQQRRKEIGIRKVQGATVSELVILLSREFASWVLTANLFAWPIGWYAMRKWLDSFAYRTELTIWPFLCSAILTMAIALLTVSYHTVKAAVVNPVESLRYE